MSFNFRLATTVATVITSLAGAFLSFCTQAAADVEYSKVGWWQVSYREVDELTGCDATAEFQDQTKIAIAFIRGGNNEGWSVFISNPRWSSWVSRKREHVLWFVAINPNKLWHGTWSAGDVSGQLYLSARPEFINSLANAKAIGIFDDSKQNLPDEVVPTTNDRPSNVCRSNPQASRFDKIDGGDFLALSEQRLISSERTSFKGLFVES
jgi:hypothetical protein